MGTAVPNSVAKMTSVQENIEGWEVCGILNNE